MKKFPRDTNAKTWIRNKLEKEKEISKALVEDVLTRRLIELYIENDENWTTALFLSIFGSIYGFVYFYSGSKTGGIGAIITLLGIVTCFAGTIANIRFKKELDKISPDLEDEKFKTLVPYINFIVYKNKAIAIIILLAFIVPFLPFD